MSGSSGDYDIDGVCSTYILLKGFQRAAKELSQRCSLEAGRYSVEKENDAQIDYEIPDRIKDGYGINESITARRPQTEWIRS